MGVISEGKRNLQPSLQRLIIKGSHKLTGVTSGLILLCSMWSNSFISGSIHSCKLSSSCSISSSPIKYEESET